MTTSRPGWAGPAALLGAVTIWGLTPTATRQLVESSFSPEQILLWRFLAGGIISASIIFLFRPAMPRRGDFPLAVGLGLFGVLGFNVPLAFGINIVEGGIAALLLGTQPGFTAMLAAIFLREAISGRMVAGLFVALVGTTMVAVAGSTAVTISSRYLFGCLLVLIAALAYAIYTVIAKPYLGQRIPGPAVAMLGTTAALPIVLPFGAPGFGQALSDLSPGGWLAAILLSAGASVIAPILFNVGLSLGRASQAGTYLYLVPVFGAISSVILLGEHLSFLAIAGGAFIVLGVAVATVPSRVFQRLRSCEPIAVATKRGSRPGRG